MGMYIWYAWILECLCMFMLIMIDVKLTPSGLWWTAYLFVWMGRRRARLVLLLAWSVLEVRGATSSICFWSLSLGLWLGCRLVFYFDVGLCCWDFTHVLGFGDYMYWYTVFGVYGMYILEMYELYPRLLRFYTWMLLNFGFWILNICFIRVFYRFNRNRVLHSNLFLTGRWPLLCFTVKWVETFWIGLVNGLGPLRHCELSPIM
jgi:hypothetical protein